MTQNVSKSACAHSSVTTREERRKTRAGRYESRFQFVCSQCGAIATILGPKGPLSATIIPWAWDMPAPKAPQDQQPVGTNLKLLINSLGLSESRICDCAVLRSEMDRLGVDGCLQNRERLIAGIRASAGKLSWRVKFKAAVPALRTGLAFRVNPFDPVPGLFDEAIRLTKRQKRQTGA